MLVDVSINGCWINGYWAVQTGLSGVLGVITIMPQTLFLGAAMSGFPLFWSVSLPLTPKVRKP